jgi:hypothetical protein
MFLSCDRAVLMFLSCDRAGCSSLDIAPVATGSRESHPWKHNTGAHAALAPCTHRAAPRPGWAYGQQDPGPECMIREPAAEGCGRGLQWPALTLDPGICLKLLQAAAVPAGKNTASHVLLVSCFSILMIAGRRLESARSTSIFAPRESLRAAEGDACSWLQAAGGAVWIVGSTGHLDLLPPDTIYTSWQNAVPALARLTALGHYW